MSISCRAEDPALQNKLELIKIIALIAMVFDHVGFIFRDSVDYPLMRAIGRECWPLLALVIAVRLWEKPARSLGYIKRLIPWAIISQAPYAVAFFSANNYPFFHTFNIMFTITLGVGVFWVMQRFTLIPALLLSAPLLYLSGYCDYGVMGAAIIPLLALLACHSVERAAAACGLLGALCNCVYLLSSGPTSLSTIMLFSVPALLASVIALTCLELPNIRILRMPGWFFYAFYPVHLSVILALFILVNTQ